MRSMIASDDWLRRAHGRALGKIARLARRMADGLPHLTEHGRYDERPPWWWTSGFWPGVLWHAWQATHEQWYADLARHAEDRTWASLVGDDFEQFTHDLGCQFLPTGVARYRLMRSEEARRRSLLAAHILAARFNPRGGFIRAWNRWPLRARPQLPMAGPRQDEQPGVTIIDTCMNLPLLFWATRETRDRRFQAAAEAHLGTVLNAFVRPDGSCHHVLLLDPDTGGVQEALGGQGAASDSAWSRGQAWAILGLAAAARWTDQVVYREAALRVCEFFLTHLPADGVAPWDFRAPRELASLRDSSANAIAACGLLELAEQLEETARTSTRDAAVQLLRAVEASCTAWHDPQHEGLLLHGISNLPAGVGVDVSLVYGDFFFVEALTRLVNPGSTLLWG